MNFVLRATRRLVYAAALTAAGAQVAQAQAAGEASAADMAADSVAQAAGLVPREHTTAEREIYAVLVAHAFHDGRPDTLLLAAESPRYQELPAGSLLRRGKEIVPPPLPARLRASSAAAAAVPVDAFPAPARVMPTARAQRLAAELQGGRKVLAVTPIAFDDDATRALVYYQTWCGRLCGGGYELWLERGPDGRWRLRQEIIHWMS